MRRPKSLIQARTTLPATELDPSSWQTFTLKKAVHEKSGRSFAELEYEVTHEG